MKLALLALLALRCAGQDNIVGVLKAADNALTSGTTPVAIVADRGDGTVVTITKRSTVTINFVVQFTDNLGHIVITATAESLSVAKDVFIKVGDAACLLFSNPTKVDVNSGSLGVVPPNAVAYSCSTNITTGGTTPPVVGLIRWP